MIKGSEAESDTVGKPCEIQMYSIVHMFIWPNGGEQ